eukprot:gene12425-biopygen4516
MLVRRDHDAGKCRVRVKFHEHAQAKSRAMLPAAWRCSRSPRSRWHPAPNLDSWELPADDGGKVMADVEMHGDVVAVRGPQYSAVAISDVNFTIAGP